MKRYKPLIRLSEQEIDKEENKRIEEILDFMRNENFTNLKKRLEFSSKLLELITLSNDARVRRLVKKIGQFIQQMEEEI